MARNTITVADFPDARHITWSCLRKYAPQQ